MEIENLKSEEYGEQYKEHLLEQWKTCVEMANCNSERRISTNNVYITVNAAIIALISFTFDYKSILLSIHYKQLRLNMTCSFLPRLKLFI
ncbi:RipA family octameric membrane protein [Garciella nitratireducens]|uniref:Uncharacterized protein n=1 Tax=Garciella nitratireducens DSM 15102 TaxID=1121911 RepID=A0A1T4NUW0_9FIRM|nr:hypothetical protein [Garciella nitratireducens]SJZ83034.1 hypothetical protein SAMN02745973_01807 [Garciella nitratireducens DSM 15102]